MADPSDYTTQWSGVFSPPRIGDEEYGGIYLLDDETSVGRNTAIYDDCTRVLYDDAHPRTHPGGQRYPGPYGAGRATDRVGPSFEERRQTNRRASAQFAGEGFASGPGVPENGVTPEEQDLYIRGGRGLGHPGPRGMVTSARDGRPAVDDIMWDNRPPHYAADTPNEYAHLYIDPGARGPPLFRKDTTYPSFQQVDRFSGTRSGPPLSDTLEIVKIVIFIIVIVLVAMTMMASNTEKRLGRELKCALREALSALPKKADE